MNQSDLIAGMNDTHLRRMSLMAGKSEDYASNMDALGNFKRMQAHCASLDIQPARSMGDCARFLMMLKIDRWCNLLAQGKTPKNEGVKDTIDDLHNYIDLAFACDLEGEVVDAP